MVVDVTPEPCLRHTDSGTQYVVCWYTFTCIFHRLSPGTERIARVLYRRVSQTSVLSYTFQPTYKANDNAGTQPALANIFPEGKWTSFGTRFRSRPRHASCSEILDAGKHSVLCGGKKCVEMPSLNGDVGIFCAFYSLVPYLYGLDVPRYMYVYMFIIDGCIYCSCFSCFARGYNSYQFVDRGFGSQLCTWIFCFSACFLHWQSVCFSLFPLRLRALESSASHIEWWKFWLNEILRNYLWLQFFVLAKFHSFK